MENALKQDKKSGIILLTYSLLIFVGGWIGFVKSSSTISLLASGCFSLALLYCSILIINRSRKGRIAANILLFILAAFFSYRFFISFKWMPGGMMSLLSLTTLFFLWKRKN